MDKTEIEEIFRSSNSHEELFDAFTEAVSNKCDDVELYKVLLANPALTIDEVIMFGEKVAKEFPGESYDLYFWMAELFSGESINPEYCEKAFQYYSKAFELKREDHEPLVAALNLYNYDLNLELNNEIINFIENGIASVKQKSKVYYGLANHYNVLNDEINFKKYSELANKASKNE